MGDMSGNNIERTSTVTILDVLGVVPCARAILDHVPVGELVRSERVCRRWQAALWDYMRHCRRTDILNDAYYFHFKSIRESKYNSYKIDLNTNRYYAHLSLFTAYNTLEKFGPPKGKIREHFEDNKSVCPYLNHLSSLSKQYFPKELILTNIFNDDDNNDCQEEFVNINDVRKYKRTKIRREIVVHNLFLPPLLPPYPEMFLRSYNKPMQRKTEFLGDILKLSLKTPDLRFAIFNLRNVTSLELDNHDMTYLDYVHLLLNEMPILEKLSLCNYTSQENAYDRPFVVTKGALVESISRLANLKCLLMRNNELVDSALFKALVQKCRRLEYFDISDGLRPNTLSLLDLCLGLPSATTTLCLGYIENFTSHSLESYLKTISIVCELHKLGWLELTPQWLEETSLASQAQRHPLKVKLRGGGFGLSVQASEVYNDLIIVLNTDVYTQKQMNGIEFDSIPLFLIIAT